MPRFTSAATLFPGIQGTEPLAQPQQERGTPGEQRPKQGAVPVPAIQITNLCKTFGGRQRAVNGLSLEIAQGEIFGLLGPNGSGKTTILNMLSGLLAPSWVDV